MRVKLKNLEERLSTNSFLHLKNWIINEVTNKVALKVFC